MTPIYRNIAIAVTLLGLMFWGYKQQLHLPKPSLNPFDDQWEMRTSWLRNNHDAIVQGPCNFFDYETSHGSYRIGYAIQDYYEDIITGKSLSVVADTIKLRKSSQGIHTYWGISSSLTDSLFVAKMDYKLLDSVCSIFGYSRLDIRASSRHEGYLRYFSPSTEDTASFNLVTQKELNDSTLVRDFHYRQWRELSTYQRPRPVLPEVFKNR